MEVKIILTEDGSHSLYVPKLNETYHSFHGAIRESRHVFITNGLLYWVEQHPSDLVSILEVGFGTGLNILLTLSEAFQKKIKLNILTLEPQPLEDNIINQLNYVQQLKAILPAASFDYPIHFNKIHQGPWNEIINIKEDILFQKQKSTLENFPDGLEKFDLVYFDAFAPSKQPELWTLEIFEKIYRLMRKGGVLVTYCAQGQFKRNLKIAGFKVESLPGPPGKKEMVRAINN